MATLVIRFPDGTLQEQELTGALTVGRASGNDVVLPEGGVSRRHARFFLEGAAVMVEDAGSANGTFVDGERIEGPTPMGPRTQVSVGDYEVSLKSARRAPAPKARVPRRGSQPFEHSEETSHRDAQRPRPRATKMVPVVSNHAAGVALAKQTKPPSNVVPAGPILRGLTGPWLNKVFLLKEVMVVGRGSDVDIQLDDDSVSRHHAELEARGGAVLLRDLGSANGTLLNGEPVAEDMELVPGDIVQFGVLEVAFENSSAALAPRRRAALAPAGDTFTGDEDGASARRPRLLKVGVGVALVLLVAVVAKLVIGPAQSPPVTTGPVLMPVADEKAALEKALGECRQYLSAANGEPELDKAEKACYRALELEPIHPEANALKNKYLRERACGLAWAKGQKELQLQREASALQYIADIEPQCAIYFKVKTQVLQAMSEVKATAAADCKRYNANGNYAQALPRCEQYMKFACQTMSEEALYPPPSDETGKGAKTWKPKDPLYAIFLKVRGRLDPGAPTWRCTPIPILQPPPKEQDRSEVAKAHFAKRIKDPDILNALVKYWIGKGNEASLALAKIRERPSKASVHALADSLRNSIDNVLVFVSQGRTAISQDKHVEAERPFLEALQLDEGIMLADDAEKMTPDEKRDFYAKLRSYYRYSIQREMGEGAYAKGRSLFDRGDPRAGCKLYRLAYAFYRENTDVTTGATRCTNEAEALFGKANQCEDFDAVLAFAIEGDGIAARVAEKKVEWKCE